MSIDPWLKLSCKAGGGWKLAGLALSVQQGFSGFASKDTSSIDYSADQTPGQRLTQVRHAVTCQSHGAAVLLLPGNGLGPMLLTCLSMA